MSKNKAFFLDTNILVKWVYRKILNENPAIEGFINSLSKGQCVVLPLNLSEFETIINDAYNMASHVIYEKIILSKPNWNKLDIEEKSRIIDDIRKDFDQLYEQIRKSKYNGQILPAGIRQMLAKAFFINLEDKLINSDLEALTNHIALTRKTEDLTAYIASVESTIREKCTIFNDIKILVNIDIIKEIQLIYESINKYISKLKFQKYKKTPSRNDQIIFQYLFLSLRGGLYDEVVFVTDDSDFQRMYDTVLEHLNDIIIGSADPRGNFKAHAEEAYEILKNKLEIKGINELIAKH
ncbi:hypothetical protein [Stygiolobus caldivivus]|uniref:Uncharacterized protein n=1 Tax=Stygiolobus caldivivus TaxID=2824673 RepID=A0A8D5U8Y2_9CREN|nr:hypothetical protein [Stygiolobus caldivivus]BCU71122.1 hypothetical protein KN1_24190 [Stygiolobus caldivivus]